MPEGEDRATLRPSHAERALSPVGWLRGEHPADVSEDGIALCLSGGGYRAMLFHVGALWRLNELGYLGRLTRVSSVSGGSITAAVLGMAWPQLKWGADGRADREAFDAAVVGPIRDVAGKTIDVPVGLLGLLTPWSINRCLTAAYDRLLFDHRTVAEALAAAPGAPTPGAPPRPTFVIDATDLRSGELWRFSPDPSLHSGTPRPEKASLAAAVAASSAFPPILGPAHRHGSTLVDGGVYDNHGLEPAWTSCRTVLISDAGGAFEPGRGTLFGMRWDWRDWGTQSMRVLKVIDHQVRELRKHQAVAGFEAPRDSREYRRGTYWGIRSHVADYPLDDPIPFDPDDAATLADTPTRLAKTPPRVQEGLINWGYAICDTAMRGHVDKGEAPRPALPYP